MFSPTCRSKYNYSAHQCSPFIRPFSKSSSGSDLNMTAGTYNRIFESKAGESRGRILLWRANAFTPTQIDSPWQKSLCCLFWAAGQDGKTWNPLWVGREKSVFVTFLQSVFYHTPLHGLSGVLRCNKARESLHRLVVLLQILSPLTCWWRVFEMPTLSVWNISVYTCKLHAGRLGTNKARWQQTINQRVTILP